MENVVQNPKNFNPDEPKTINRWNRKHTIILILIFAASLLLNLLNSDLGAPVYKKWFPFSTEMASYFNSHGTEARGEFEYSSLGYQHYLPTCLIYMSITDFFLKNENKIPARKISDQESYPLLRWTNGFLSAVFILLFVLLLRFIVNPRWLVFTALLICLNSRFIYWSHTESIMMLNVLWAMICVVFFVRYLFYKSWANLALMTICGAISVGIKENTLAIVPVLAFTGPILVTGFLRTFSTRKGIIRLIVSLFVCLVCFIGVLAIAYWSNPSFNQAHLRFYLEGENTNYSTASTQVGSMSEHGPAKLLVFYLQNFVFGTIQLFDEAGIVLAILILPGMFWAFRNYRKYPFVSGFFVALLGYMLSYVSVFPIFWRQIQDYDLLFPVLILMLFAACGFDTFLKICSARNFRYASTVVVAILLYCGFGAVMTVVALKMDVRLLLEDYLAAKERPIIVTVVEYPRLKISLGRFPDLIVQNTCGPSEKHFANARSDYLVLDDNLRRKYDDYLKISGVAGRFIHEKTFRQSKIISAYMMNSPITIHLFRRE